MSIVVRPGLPSTRVLVDTVGSRSDMLASTGVNVSTPFLRAMDQLEEAQLRRESQELAKPCRQYDDSELTTGESVSSASSGTGAGLITGVLFTPLVGFVVGYVTTGVVSIIQIVGRGKRNRQFGQDIVCKIADIGMARVWRLGEKIEQVNQRVQTLKTNNEDRGGQISVNATNETWIKKTKTQISDACIEINYLCKAGKYFEGIRDKYSKRLTSKALNDKKFVVGKWTYNLWLEKDVLKIGSGH